jgi:oxygen-independent coproporphyrinogen-3 oxidase
MEGYFEVVVDTLTAAGYRWYETANFCREAALAGGRDLRARHNLAYWTGRDYLGIGIGAVSTVAGVRRTNRPGLGGYVASLLGGERPPREVEDLDEETRRRERLLLGLRLDEPLPVAGVGEVLDAAAVERMAAGGLLQICANGRGPELRLTRRGRFLGGGVTAELLR